MEEDSIEDGALKDYFERGRKKKERKKKKDRKRADRDKANEREEDTSGKQGEVATLRRYCVHSTLVPVVVPIFFPPHDWKIHMKELLLSNGRVLYGKRGM